MSGKIYIVIRVHGSKERTPDDRYSFYGWSFDKKIVKAFLKQRSPDKYTYRTFDIESDGEILQAFPEIEDGPSSYTMIDYTKLKFASTKEEMYFFTTLSEMKEAELCIQKRFHDMSSIDDMDVLNIFIHLDRYYLDALELLGFRPKEVDYIYDTSDPRDNYNTYCLAEGEIEDAYDGAADYPHEEFGKYMNVPGLAALTQVADKCLYSVENFITALRNEL